MTVPVGRQTTTEFGRVKKWHRGPSMLSTTELFHISFVLHVRQIFTILTDNISSMYLKKTPYRNLPFLHNCIFMVISMFIACMSMHGMY